MWILSLNPFDSANVHTLCKLNRIIKKKKTYLSLDLIQLDMPQPVYLLSFYETHLQP